MYRFTFTLPACLNDGAPVDPADIALVESRLLDAAGGFTSTASVGVWRAPDGTVYREPVTVYALDAARDLTSDLRQLAEWAALALDQEAIYVTRLPILAADLIAAPSFT